MISEGALHCVAPGELHARSHVYQRMPLGFTREVMELMPWNSCSYTVEAACQHPLLPHWYRCQALCVCQRLLLLAPLCNTHESGGTCLHGGQVDWRAAVLHQFHCQCLLAASEAVFQDHKLHNGPFWRKYNHDVWVVIHANGQRCWLDSSEKVVARGHTSTERRGPVCSVAWAANLQAHDMPAHPLLNSRLDQPQPCRADFSPSWVCPCSHGTPWSHHACCLQQSASA